jgi:hypothetical protein
VSGAKSYRLFALLAAASAFPAFAGVVAVPQDYPTIQQAIDAVQGTEGATVRISSNKTFDETLRIEDSVVLEAAAKFKPTVRGRREACDFPVPGSCTLAVQPLAQKAVRVTLRGLRLVPGNAARAGDRVVQAWVSSTAALDLYLSNVTLDGRGKPVHGIVIREEGTEDGSTRLIVQDSLLRLGGAGSVTAIDATGAAEVHFDRSRLVMNGAINAGIRVDNSGHNVLGSLQVDQSTFDLAAKTSGGASVHLLVRQVVYELNDNSFLSRTAGRAQIFGLVDAGDRTHSTSRIDRNGFDHKGAGQAFGLLFSPRDGTWSDALVADNVFTNQAWAIAAVPGPRRDGDPESLVRLQIVNNTIDRSTIDGVFLESGFKADVAAGFSNNLVTRSRGYAVNVNGEIKFGGAHNGYFANGLGNVEAPYATKEDVLGDPRYVSNTDLRLRPDSPMIDAGLDEAAPPDLIFDRRGNGRRNGPIDIGAFER